MKRLALIFALLCSLPGWAAITFVDKCVGTTSCTVPTHQQGDFMIAFPTRDGSATAPANPAASFWVSPGGTACAAGAGTCTINGTSTADSAVRISCKIAQGTSGSDDTATGFTNAGSLEVQIWRGVNIQAGADCTSALAHIVWTATSINTTSTSMVYASVTNTFSTSWNVGFGFAPAASAHVADCVTGLATLRNSSGTIASACDSNGAQASFTTQTVTITTASRIITAVVELAAAVAPAAPSGAYPISARNDIETTPTFEPASALVINSPKLTYPNPVGLHNLLWCGVSWLGSAVTLNSATDNQTNTWTQAVLATGASNEGNGIVKSAIWYAPDAKTADTSVGGAAGYTTVTFTFSGVTQAHFSCHEWYNVATTSPLDVATATPDIQASGNAVLVAAGSQTTTVDNDLVVYYGLSIDAAIGGFAITVRPTGYGVATGWTKTAGNWSAGLFGETLVWGSHGAINPAMTVYSATSDTMIFNAVGASFKAASAGTAPPAGIRIDHLFEFQADNTTSYKIDFPCTGNLAVLTWGTLPADDNLTTATIDGNTLTVVADVASRPQLEYWAAATPTDNSVATITHGAFQGSQQSLYCISGAHATAPFDNTTTDAQTSPNGGNLTSPLSITPGTSNGLVLCQLSNSIGPETAAVSPFIFNNVPYTNETDNGQMNSGDAQSHYYNPNTSAVTCGYTVTTASNGSTWFARASAWQAPAAAAVRKRVITIWR